MEKILFISSEQYGYNTDYLKYCEYLSDEYKIYFVCFYSYKPKYDSKNINVYYINYKRGIFPKMKLINLGTKIIKEINPDFVFIKYFPSCSRIYRKLKNKKIVIDIRSGSVEKSVIKRKLKNILIRVESNRFRYISIITEGLAEKLMLPKKKIFILPLGADRVIDTKIIANSFTDSMNLLYIGTFYQRKIEDTILGFKLFYDKYGDKISCKYTIIGFGYEKDEKNIIDLINKLGLQNHVFYLGRKRHDELTEYYETHNIGVSYVPITDYFQHQPPTKTYEYICNGLICIATNIKENTKIINSENGVLIKEGPNEFFNGLSDIYINLKKYDRDKIIKNGEKYSWENIVTNILKPFIQRI